MNYSLLLVTMSKIKHRHVVVGAAPEVVVAEEHQVQLVNVQTVALIVREKHRQVQSK